MWDGKLTELCKNSVNFRPTVDFMSLFHLYHKCLHILNSPDSQPVHSRGKKWYPEWAFTASSRRMEIHSQNTRMCEPMNRQPAMVEKVLLKSSTGCAYTAEMPESEGKQAIKSG